MLHTTRSHAQRLGSPILAATLFVSAACRAERGPGISTNFPYEVEGALLIVEARDTIEVIPAYEHVMRLGGLYYYIHNMSNGAGSVVYDRHADRVDRLFGILESNGGNGVLVYQPQPGATLAYGRPIGYELVAVDGERSVMASMYDILEDHVRVVRADSVRCYDFSLAPAAIPDCSLSGSSAGR